MGPTAYEPVQFDQDIDYLPAADAEDATDADETAEMRAARLQVEQTRAEMSETIEAIKERLNPHHLAEQAKEMAYDATIGRAQEAVGGVTERAQEAMHGAAERVSDAAGAVRDRGEDLMDLVRRNPIPAAMVGIGLGWLFMSARRQPNGGRYYDYDGRDYSNGYSRDYGRTYGRGDYGGSGYAGTSYDDREGTGIRETVSGAMGTVADRASEVKHRAGEMVGEVRDRASEMAWQARERASETAHAAREKAAAAAEEARYRASLARMEVRDSLGECMDSFQRTVQSNPLAVGAVALGIGAAVGMMVPSTQPEHRMMGETRDRLMDRAQDVAQEVKQKAQHVAGEVVTSVQNTVEDQVRAEGLSG